MKLRSLFWPLAITIIATACKNDDDSEDVAPPRAMAEVATENDDEIQSYLRTHFYNYDDFENPPTDFDYKIVLDTIEGDNAGKIPLADMPGLKSKTITVTAAQLGLDTGEANVAFTYYYLSVRDGEGPRPTIGDSVFLKYEGRLLNDYRFDYRDTYGWQNLPQTIRGYADGISNFNSGGDTVLNPDGTYEIPDTGIGLMILPSGLGYFNSIAGSIPAYSPLIFKVEIGKIVENTDYDGDGIPSIFEDLNQNGYLGDDNTDLESEKSLGSAQYPNYMDSDDDNDGIPTRDEIEIDDNGNITFPDSDGDGIPDYLDAD